MTDLHIFGLLILRLCVCIHCMFYVFQSLSSFSVLTRNQLCQVNSLGKKPTFDSCDAWFAFLSWEIKIFFFLQKWVTQQVVIGQNTPVYKNYVRHLYTQHATDSLCVSARGAEVHMERRGVVRWWRLSERNIKLWHRKEMEQQKVSSTRCYIISMSSIGPKGRK